MTFFENKRQSDTGETVVIEDYLPDSPVVVSKDASAIQSSSESEDGDLFRFSEIADQQADFRVFTTMATWCASCKNHLPIIEELTSNCPSGVRIYGLPVDPKDSVQMLEQYEGQHEVAYQLLKNIKNEVRQEIGDYIFRELGTNALPVSIVTDQRGNVQILTKGIPTLSELRELAE